MTATLEPDDDFSDLDAEIATVLAAQAQAKALIAKKKKLTLLAAKSNHDDDPEYRDLLTYIRRYEDGVVWQNVSATALFYIQDCVTCNSRHRFFQGWMTEQRHKTDPQARRLVRGYPVEPLPERIEEHLQGMVDICGNCAESVLAINAAAKGTL